MQPKEVPNFATSRVFFIRAREDAGYSQNFRILGQRLERTNKFVVPGISFGIIFISFSNLLPSLHSWECLGLYATWMMMALACELKVLEKVDLTYRQAKKAVEQVNAGVLTTFSVQRKTTELENSTMVHGGSLVRRWPVFGRAKQGQVSRFRNESASIRAQGL